MSARMNSYENGSSAVVRFDVACAMGRRFDAAAAEGEVMDGNYDSLTEFAKLERLVVSIASFDATLLVF